MKIFFASKNDSSLASAYDHEFLIPLQRSFAQLPNCAQSNDPVTADAIILHEAYSFKEWRYVRRLLHDPLTARFAGKLFVVNADDCATGLLRGLYTSLPKRRFDPARHRTIPFVAYNNDRVLHTAPAAPTTELLASWRGNLKSNRLRWCLVELLRTNRRFAVETTETWQTHDADEKEHYVRLVQSAEFSLCPAGWAPATMRIYESMALGRAPVIIADQFVPPAGPNWDAFSIRVPERHLDRLPAILERHLPRAAEMGRLARREWERYFAPERVYSYCAHQMLDLIERSGASTQDREAGIWRSFRMYYANGWTLPQRILTRVRRLARRQTAMAKL